MSPIYDVPIADSNNPEGASRWVEAKDADQARELALVKLVGDWRVTGEPVLVEELPEPYVLPEGTSHPASALGAAPVGDPDAKLPEHLTRKQRQRFGG